jgi:hypothetical protein
VNLMLDSLAASHHDQIAQGRAHQLSSDEYADHLYSEKEKSFLSIFKGCLIAKQEEGFDPVSAKSLMNASQHLLFALYIMRYTKARDSKVKLLYTLNAFRAV